MSEQARRQFIAGLRALAAFYESRPGAYYDGMRVTISMYAAGRRAPKAFAAMAAAFAGEDGKAGAAQEMEAERCGGSCCAHAVLARDFSAKVRLEIFAPRASLRSAECEQPL